jgi:hypothetical protein
MLKYEEVCHALSIEECCGRKELEIYKKRTSCICMPIALACFWPKPNKQNLKIALPVALTLSLEKEEIKV